MKKVLSVALALVLCLAMCVPAFAADTQDPVDQIAGVLDRAGIDLSAITEKLSSLGSFDIGSLTGGDFDISAITDALGSLSDLDIASLKDTLIGALGNIGGGDFDIAGILNGLKDNELAQLIAKLYSIGTPEKETTTEAPTETEPEAPTETEPEEIPDTGDSAIGLAVLGVVSVAAAAAFVCTRKKEA
jgi:LPXTG-motif cell wall-anchored protein